MIKIFAVSGYKNSGKTTLCLSLLRELTRLGVKTGYIKRTSEDIMEGGSTDTALASACGVRTLLWGPDGIRAEEPAAAPTPDELAAAWFPEAELLIVEGGKKLPLPRIWVENGTPPEGVSGIIARYDRKSAGDGKMLFGAGDEAALARILASSVRGRFYRSSKVYIGNRPLPMKDFIADFVRGAVIGMLASLKGGRAENEQIRIYIEPDRK